ncbi:site-specific DNA-methyltransferase [Anaerococcus hydrogenalis]|nr:site-specific DNA-methyltransferase [Anaerococcus hydrogenalis]
MSNLSQKRRAEMLEYLNHLKEIHTDDESRIALSKIETALTEKKYGLVWEEHEEEVDKQLVHNIPVFREIEDKKIIGDNTSAFNFILEGDNLHSLKLLEKTHKGKVDVIYIDPPYNTGNKDFIYDDNYIGSDDGYRHSKWLSFMNERLRIARKLLSKEGVIFCSIGDDELSQFKIILDEIFGEDNFINLVSVKTKNAAGASGGGQDLKLKKNLEYLIIYSKDIKFLPEFNTVYKLTEIEELLDYYKENDISWKYTSVLVNPGRKKYIGSTVDGAGDEIKIYKRQNPIFMSVNQVAKKDNISVREVYKNYFNQIHMTAMPQSSIRKRVFDYIGEDNLDKESLYSIEYIPISGRNKGRLYEQFYKGQKLRLIAWFADVGVSNSDGVFKKDIEGTYWDGIELNNLSKEGNVKFSNGKKPLSLLNRIIKMYKYKDAVILDYFAGSGTTGHAVVQLNKEDGGDRKYILCTNNENNICEKITYQRMKNIQGELPHNLKYYRTEFIPKLSEDEEILSSKLLDYIKEMVELENMCEIDGVKRRIILSDEDLNIALSEMEESGVLYIPSFILLTNEIKDSIEERKLEVVTIPDYYFTEELREVNEL